MKALRYLGAVLALLSAFAVLGGVEPGPCAQDEVLFQTVLGNAPCDAAGQTLIAAMTTPPSGARRKLICQTVRGIEATGAWQVCDAIHVYAASTSQAALLNWIKPGSLNATNSGASFTVDRGLAGDASSTFVDTNVNPALTTNFSQDSATLAGWALTQASTNNAMLGWAVAGGNGAYLAPRVAANAFQANVNNALTGTGSFSNSDGRGLYSVRRTASSGFLMDINGANVAAPAATSTTPVNHTFRVDMAAAGSFSAVLVAMDMECGFLSASQMAGVYAVLHPYMQTVAGAP